MMDTDYGPAPLGDFVGFLLSLGALPCCRSLERISPRCLCAGIRWVLRPSSHQNSSVPGFVVVAAWIDGGVALRINAPRADRGSFALMYS